MASKYYRKHMTIEIRNKIEDGLNKGYKFKSIADSVFKDQTTIGKEVKNRRTILETSSYGVSKEYNKLCSKTLKPPYVCNNCKTKHHCHKQKYYYRALNAQADYKELLINSRIGIDMDSEEFNRLNKELVKAMNQNHSFSLFLINHKKDFSVSKRTLYNYVEKGYLDIINLDLPRKVRYKKRKKKTTPVIRNTKIRENRTYQDYLAYCLEFPELITVQMDTVEGIKGSHVLLTLLFTNCNLILALKMEFKDSESVSTWFLYLKQQLTPYYFYILFPIILTDNGTEFSNPELIEDNGSDVPKTKVFFCDPRQSQQKGALENNHQYIRRFIPKGTDIALYTDEDIALMMSHINSTPREKFNDFTPLELSEIVLDPSIKFLLEILDYKTINKHEIYLNDEIFKKEKDTNHN